MEKWLPVVGFEGLYEVSDLGRLRSLDRAVRNTENSEKLIRGRIRKPWVSPVGYRVFTLSKDSRKKSCRIHRLVAIAFHGPGEEGQEVLHTDGDKGNNAANNLRWGTRQMNMADRARLGEGQRGETHWRATLNEAQIIAIRNDSRQREPIAAEYGVSANYIGQIKNRIVWRHID